MIINAIKNKLLTNSALSLENPEGVTEAPVIDEPGLLLYASGVSSGLFNSLESSFT